MTDTNLGNIEEVLIVANYQKPEAKPLSHSIQIFLEEKGVKSEVFGFSGKADLVCERNYDLAITLGGDGTVLFASRILAPLNIPILPINLGNFGFITEVSKDDWQNDLERVLKGEVNLGSRMMLSFNLKNDASKRGGEELCGRAMNDVVISGSGISKLVNLMVHLDESEHIEYKADGIIFSTSTGSTAYSAAAGGPILHPEMNAIILNPICPFTLSHRPLVLPSESELRVEIAEDQRTELTLTVDGQLSYPLKSGDELFIRKASSAARILYSGSRSFYEVLRAKLSWTGGPE
ncbi:NAD(+)/NADH kinase [Salinispira pacifica]|nr:NAD(+)/NADH kinase [Salinispira pacifica]